MISLAHSTVKHPDPQFHTDADYQASIERAKAANARERAEAIKKVPALGKLLRVEVRPLPASTLPLADRVECQDHIDEAFTRWGSLAVVRAVCVGLAAINRTLSARTLDEVMDELSQGEERQ